MSVKVIIKFDQTKESRKLNSTGSGAAQQYHNIMRMSANIICLGPVEEKVREE